MPFACQPADRRISRRRHAEEEELPAEKEEPQAEGGRASLLDEVGVLYFVAKARDAFRGRAAH